MNTTRKPMVAGNWKMNKTLAEAASLAREIRQGYIETMAAEVVLAPPFTALATVARELHGSPIQLAAQDMFWEKQGAFTGAISPLMLTDVGCRLVIIGHSERRQYFGETNGTVNKKIQAALDSGFDSHRLHRRDPGAAGGPGDHGGYYLPGYRRSGRFRFRGHGRLIIAYEPVWAIGTGRTATPDQAQEVHSVYPPPAG